jgi:hypothetical protein
MAKGTRLPRENGYIIFESDEIVAIATGFKSSSANTKTGGMIQTWFLDKRINPAEAVKTGQDKAVCFDCPFAGGNGCYVAVGKAPLGVWRKYQRGGYFHLVDLSLIQGRKFRFGSYGEPILLPIETVRTIAVASNGWTGYTHQWRQIKYLAYRDYLMASTSDADDELAKRFGWRTFCVTDSESSNSIMCPASAEAGHRTTCKKCGLCSGKLRKTARGIVANVAKSIRIKSHGIKKNAAYRAIAKQIGTVAA